MATTLKPDLLSTIVTLVDWTFLANSSAKLHTFLDFVLGAGSSGPVEAARFWIQFVEGGSSPNAGLQVDLFKSGEFANTAPSTSWADDQIAYEESPSHSIVIPNGSLNSTLDTQASTGSAVLSVAAHGGIEVGNQIAVVTDTGASDLDFYTVTAVDTGANDITVERNADAAYASSTAVRKVHQASIAVIDPVIATARALLTNLDTAGTDARVRILATILKGSVIGS